MYAQIDIKTNDNGATITIKSKSTAFIKTVMIIFIVAPILVLPILVGIALFNGNLKPEFSSLLLLGGTVFLIMFVYKHLKRVFGKEVLTINSDKLIYQNSFLGLGKYFETESNKIKGLKHIGYYQQTKHPLEIKGDALGFGTQQSEMNYLNQTGTMMLATEYEILKFGVDVDEEDFLKVKQLIYQFV